MINWTSTSKQYPEPDRPILMVVNTLAGTKEVTIGRFELVYKEKALFWDLLAKEWLIPIEDVSHWASLPEPPP